MNQKSPGEFYVTTFCNFAHATATGRPIGHECYILDPKKLQLEATGQMDKIEGSIVKEPRKMVQGKAPKP